MNEVIWDSASAEPLNTDLAGVIYQMRRDDSEGLALDAATIADLLLDSEAVALDALVVEYAKIDRKVAQLEKIMGSAGTALSVTASQVTEPFKQRGTTQVAALFELSDGQTVSVFFHNPDITPNKVAPSDELVSWKWLLNKKDITILVAPEKGSDLNPREVARRIMRLAEKNSDKFQKANAGRADKLAAIESLKAAAEAKGAELEALTTEVAELTAKVQNKPAKATDDPTNPVAEQGALPWDGEAAAEDSTRFAGTTIKLTALDREAAEAGLIPEGVFTLYVARNGGKALEVTGVGSDAMLRIDARKYLVEVIELVDGADAAVEITGDTPEITAILSKHSNSLERASRPKIKSGEGVEKLVYHTLSHSADLTIQYHHKFGFGALVSVSGGDYRELAALIGAADAEKIKAIIEAAKADVAEKEASGYWKQHPFNTIGKITLVWGEGTADRNKEFASLDDLQAWFKKTFKKVDSEGGYFKNRLSIVLTNDLGGEQVIEPRVDVSDHEGDFNPHKQTIREYLREIGYNGQDKRPLTNGANIYLDVGSSDSDFAGVIIGYDRVALGGKVFERGADGRYMSIGRGSVALKTAAVEAEQFEITSDADFKALGVADITSVGGENIYMKKDGVRYFAKVGNVAQYSEGQYDFSQAVLYPEPVATTTTTNTELLASFTPEQREKMRLITEGWTIAKRKLADGSLMTDGYVAKAFAAIIEKEGVEEANKKLDATVASADGYAIDALTPELAALYKTRFQIDSYTSINLTQIVAAAKNGTLDIANHPYADAIKRLFKIKVVAAAGVTGLSSEAAAIYEQFQTGNFAQSRLSGDEAYKAAVKKFLEGDLTAPMPKAKGDHIEYGASDIEPKPIDKGVKVLKKPTEIIDSLRDIAATSDIRYYLNGVHIDEKNKLAVATDGYRMIVVNDIDLSELPARKAGEEEYTVIGHDGKWMGGRFPDWRRLFSAAERVTGFDDLNTKKLAAKARGAVKVGRYTGAKGLIALPLMLNGTERLLNAKYIEQAMVAFQRFGYQTAKVAAKVDGLESTTDTVFMKSADGKVQQIIMPIRARSSGAGSILAPVGTDGEASAKPLEAVSPTDTKAPDELPFRHVGFNIYPLNGKWAVQSIQNVELEKQGARQVGGDGVFTTKELAIAEAELQAQRVKGDAEYAEEVARREAAEREAKAARDAEFSDIGGADDEPAMTRERRIGALSKMIRHDGVVLTKKAFIEKLVAEGANVRVTMVDKIKPMSRTAFNRASNAEQAAHAKKIADGGKVPEYELATADKTIYELGKFEYDYAVRLIAKRGDSVSYADWEREVTDIIGEEMGATNSDAQGLMERHDAIVQSQFAAGADPKDAANAVLAAISATSNEDRNPFEKKWPLTVDQALALGYIESAYNSYKKRVMWHVGVDSQEFMSGGEALDYYYNVVKPRDEARATQDALDEDADSIARFVAGKAILAFKENDSISYIVPNADKAVIVPATAWRSSVFSLEDQYKVGATFVSSMAAIDEALAKSKVDSKAPANDGLTDAIAYLQSVVDGEVDFFDDTLADKLTALYEAHSSDEAFAELFERAATAYSDAMIAAAKKAMG